MTTIQADFDGVAHFVSKACGLAATLAESLGLSVAVQEFTRLCRRKAEPQTLIVPPGKP